MVAPLTTGKPRAASTDGEALNNLNEGLPYLRRARAEHYVFNANDFEFAIIEIELPPAASVEGN